MFAVIVIDIICRIFMDNERCTFFAACIFQVIGWISTIFRIHMGQEP